MQATLVDTGFGPDYQSYHYVRDGRQRLAIEIIEGDKLLTQEEHDRLQAERETKRAAEKSPVTTEAATGP